MTAGSKHGHTGNTGNGNSPAARDPITEIRIRPVPDGRDGLLGYASCVYHGVGLNDIAIRRDETGKLFLTFPRKVSSTGHPHPIHFPLNREVAAQFERAILGQLRRLAGINTTTENGGSHHDSKT